MTDHELILARVWAMMTEVERYAIADVFINQGSRGEVYLDKLAADWIESLYRELKAKGKNP